MKEYQNRDWLYEEYVVKRKTVYRIGAAQGVSSVTIGKWLHKLGIPLRSKKSEPRKVLDIHYISEAYNSGQSLKSIARTLGVSSPTIRKRLEKAGVHIRSNQDSKPSPLGLKRAQETYRNRKWLREQYQHKKRSQRQIADMLGVDRATIHNWLHKFNIPVRSISEGDFEALKNDLDPSTRLLSFIEGELLGDGSLIWTSRGHYSAWYKHSSKYREYLIWLSSEFASQGLEQSGKIRSRVASSFGNSRKKYKSYEYSSRAYPFLADLKRRFYPDGIKIVPIDLALDPIKLRQFYIGDGYLARPHKGRPYIVLSTCSFDKKSIDILISQLLSLGISAVHQPSKNTIRIPARSIEAFFDFIGPCPVKCYAYKWLGGTELHSPLNAAEEELG
ncbi:helix-turn-helix domain-containing protein [candidate division WOR-3 bacterium]|nr:helix-turn-helix domain-containing protein [candidate division WOR-3 bacterium]